MEGVSTDSLRSLALKWSLAGDDHLLKLLQSTHQRIITKCQDVNSKLEEMASVLDDASIHLQNVNNKFMALSNSQFIESRVYDDDADLATDTQPDKEIPQPSSVDEISMLKNSLAILELAHDSAEILDDSDSDSDAEISLVLKPKDVYSHRPLPYIIGSQSWKNKWHAGLIVEDSDTDSSTSKQDRDIEQYSDSEEELSRPPLEEHMSSESSSSLPGSVGAPAQPPGAPPAARPADIAAALARRLAGDPTTLVQEEADVYPPAPSAQLKKVYKPEQPATSTIFWEEPPPLEDSPDHSSDEDIFAEINKHTPYTQRSKVEANLAEDLFSFEKPSVEDGNIFSDFAQTRVQKPPAKQKSTLFEGESEPELFSGSLKNEAQNSTPVKDEPTTKKPVGGISLFGSNKGAERIGAAILKRNQRKSSTSSEESGSDDVKNRNDDIKKQILESKPTATRTDEKSESKVKSRTTDETDNKSTAKKEKDIFDDLFSKSEKIQKKSPLVAKQPVKDKVTPVKENVTAVKEKTNIKDLFSDNIFDDIDDIFTSNVKIPTKESNQKSIFDDDDLFSDISITKSANLKTNNKESAKYDKTNVKDKNNKSIFDSDDELFGDIKTGTDKSVATNIEPQTSKDNKTDNDEVPDKNISSEVISKVKNVKKPTETTKERNLFDDSPQVLKSDLKPQMKSKSIFDSDSDDDIFAKLKTPDNKKTLESENSLISSEKLKITVGKEDLLNTESNNSKSKLATTNVIPKENVLVQSPSLFKEDEIDDLFIVANKSKSESKDSEETKVAEVKNIPSTEKEPVVENFSKENKINPSTESYITEKNNLPKTAVDSHTLKKLDAIPNQDMISDKDIFDDNLRNDNLFSTTKDVLKNKSSENNTEIAEVVESIQEVRQSETKQAINAESEKMTNSRFKDTKTIEVETDTNSIIQTSEEEYAKQSIFEDFIEPTEEEEALKTRPKIPVPNTNIFDDIFTEPPAFEKPAEAKKSKNINALFDDDSDDESLFFKKDDIISDEKPEIFSKNVNFDIFVDEPPAIDVDFNTKSVKHTDIDDDLFSSVPRTHNLIQATKTVIQTKDIFSPIPEMAQKVSKFTENIGIDNGDKLFSSVSKKVSVCESVKVENNVDFNSVPDTQEKVLGNFNEDINEKTIDDKPKISNKISETKPLSKEFKSGGRELFSPEINKIEARKSNVLSNVIDSDDELFASLPNLPKSSQKDQTETLKCDFNPIVVKNNTDEFDDIFKSEPSKKDTEVKKIGKLNTKNLNINVNALIPGASPKKIPKERKDVQKSEIDEPKMFKLIPDENDFEPKTTSNKDVNKVAETNIKSGKLLADETDFQSKSTSDRVENEIADQQEPKTEKSVTFHKKSESEVLDNNLSKQRPRIQVKRRPSSRKARHEAVRKSGIDFGDDTDNSSSFDEPKPRSENKEDTNICKENKNLVKENQNFSKKDNNPITVDNHFSNEENSSIKSQQKDSVREDTKISKEDKNTKNDINSKSDIFESIMTNLPPNKDTAEVPISNEIKEARQVLTQNLYENKQTTTKIVYILNDEDIFTTKSKNTENLENTFGSKDSETADIFDSGKGIHTLGKTYKGDTEKKTKEELTSKSNQEEIKTQEFVTKDIKSSNNNKASLFDDSDEELFNKKKKIVKKTVIFDSDSEEDLFSGKTSTEKNNKEVRNREVKERKELAVKGSLFGDDDDDDDLFGVEKLKTIPKHQSSVPSTSKDASSFSATASKATEPVFNDPLSMLGDDD